MDGRQTGKMLHVGQMRDRAQGRPQRQEEGRTGWRQDSRVKARQEQVRHEV